MLRISAVFGAIRLAQVVGQRQYGHFDHDAMAATGPQSKRKGLKADKPKKAKTARALAVGETTDPITGEPIAKRSR
jgi:hypothetical protein